MVVVDSCTRGRGKNRPGLILAANLLAAIFFFVPNADALPPEIDRAFDQLLEYKTGDQLDALNTIEEAVGNAQRSFARSREYEARLIEVLSNAQLGSDARRFAASQLRRVATEKAVPSFESMLYNSNTTDIALFALEEIPGLDAQDALHRALDKTVGEFRVRIIRTLGRREELAAVPRLVRLTGKGDPKSMEAAIWALGEIGGPRATKDLLWCRQNTRTEFRPLATQAFFRCAEKYLQQGNYEAALDMYDTLFVDLEPRDVRRTALEGMLRAERDGAGATIVEVLQGREAFLHEVALEAIPAVPGARATHVITDALPTLSTSLRARTIDALAQRGDPAALPAVYAAAKESDVRLRAAAIRAMALLGDGSSVSRLLEFATGPDPNEQTLARFSLARAQRPGFEDALLQAALGSNNAHRAETVRTIVQREMRGSVPLLIRIAERDVEPLQIEALRGLGLLASEKELSDLVSLLLDATRPAVRDEAVRAVVAATIRLDKSIDRTQAIRDALQRRVRSTESQVMLVNILGEIGDDSGLPAIRSVVRKRDPRVETAIIRVLSEWQSPAPLDDLERVASRVEDPAMKRAAVDGYIRLLLLPYERPVEATLRYYGKAVRLAAHPDQKKRIIEGLATVRHEAAAELLKAYLDDPDVGDFAAHALDGTNLITD